jgi:hypothetical protein
MGLLRRIEAYVYKHNDDRVYHDDRRGAPKEHSILRNYVSWFAGMGGALAYKASHICLPWLEEGIPCSRVPGKTPSLWQVIVGR